MTPFLDEAVVAQHLRMADLIPAMEKALVEFSLALIPLVPPGVPVIAACAGALLGLRGRSS